MFDPQRGSWQALGAQLTSERKYCAAASLGGRLLVLGGMNEARRRCGCGNAHMSSRQSVHCSLLEMRVRRKQGCGAHLAPCFHFTRSAQHQVSNGLRLHGTLLSRAGLDALLWPCRLSSVEAYDPREGRWTELTSMQVGSSTLSAASRALGYRCCLAVRIPGVGIITVNVTYGVVVLLC